MINTYTLLCLAGLIGYALTRGASSSLSAGLVASHFFDLDCEVTLFCPSVCTMFEIDQAFKCCLKTCLNGDLGDLLDFATFSR